MLAANLDHLQAREMEVASAAARLVEMVDANLVGADE